MLKGLNYEISKKNFFAHEWIGLPVSVIESNDKNKKEMSGIVIDETKNVIVVQTKNGEKIVPKKEGVFSFSLGEEKIVLDGKKFLFRPEDRVKVFWRSC